MADANINAEQGTPYQEQALRDKVARIIRIADEITDKRLGKFYSDDYGNFASGSETDIFRILNVLSPKGQRFTDLGSGDGRWVFAASAFGADAEGYEINPNVAVVAEEIKRKLIMDRVLSSEELVRARLYRGDLLKADISQSDVLLYWEGSGAGTQKVEHKILTEAKPGAKVVVYGYLKGFERLKLADIKLPFTRNQTRVYIK